MTLDAVSDVPQVGEADYPTLFTLADSASRRAQSAYKRWIRVDLALLVAAAALSTATGLLPSPFGTPLSVLSVVFLAATIVIEWGIHQGRFEERWYDGRYVAESIKSASWRYMMQVPPFDGSEEAAARPFDQVVREALLARPDLQQKLVRSQDRERVVSPCMLAVRGLPLDGRRDLYLQQRVVDQIRWYASKSRRNADNARIWFIINLASRALAVAYAFYFIFRPNAPHVTEVFAAIAAAVTAWGQLGRHRELSRSYDVAARELQQIRDRMADAAGSDRFDEHVVEAEDAISREHTMWMTKRT